MGCGKEKQRGDLYHRMCSLGVGNDSPDTKENNTHKIQEGVKGKRSEGFVLRPPTFISSCCRSRHTTGSVDTSCQPQGWNPRVCPSCCHPTKPPRILPGLEPRNEAGTARSEVKGQRESKLRERAEK